MHISIGKSARAINIYERQIKQGEWKNYVENFEQIKLELEK